MEGSTFKRDLKPPFYVDVVLVSLTLILVGFSMVMVYSTTGILSQEKFGDPLFFVKRQGAAALVGLAMMFVLSRVPMSALKKISRYCLPVCLALLILPLVPGLSDSAGGAKRWVGFSVFKIQPGEFVKFLWVIFLAGYLERHEAKIQSFFHGIVKPFALVGSLAAMLLLQPDFGSASVVTAVTLCMVLAAGVRLRYVVICAAVAAAAAVALVILSPYRMSRIISFMSPWADASGKGYQLIQSLIAVGTGQLTGVGLGSSQQKLFFLPAAHTDFIFAVISEEMGFIGGACLLSIFLLMLWRGMRLAGRVTDDTFTYTLTVGLTMLIVLPALLNMGVVLGLLPTKGLVLPLVGYGGSSLVASLLIMGLLLAATRSFYLRFI